MERRIRDTMDDVRVHRNGQAPEAARSMGALAFTTGNHVAFAGSPSLHTAAHEAAHVVQQPSAQRQGRSPQQSAAASLAHELACSSTPPHEGRVVVTAPPLPATPNQTLGAAHATVKNLANIEQTPPSAGPSDSAASPSASASQ
jgi:hypothetical protein